MIPLKKLVGDFEDVKSRLDTISKQIDLNLESKVKLITDYDVSDEEKLVLLNDLVDQLPYSYRGVRKLYQIMIKLDTLEE